MEKRLFWWEVGAAAVTAVLGTLFHFLFGWSGGNPVIGAFTAVNESVWEHMKLLFFPLFLEFFVHSAALGRVYPNLPAARAAGTLAGLALIPVGFYTYTGVFGTHALWADITLFFAAVALGCSLEFVLLHRSRLSALWMQVAGLLVLWLLAFVFVWCTFHPPEIGLWQDAGTGGFGIKARFGNL